MVWTEDASFQQRLGEAARVTSALLAASVIAGFLVAGFGGRLLMRLIAITSDDRAQGRLTKADEVVGQVTAGGTTFFVFFSAGFGVLGGLGLFLLRRWLPTRSVFAGLTVSGIGAGLLARPSDLLNPDSIDFEILGPRWLASLLGLTLIAGLGALGAVLIDTFVKHWPRPALSPKGLAGLLPLLPLVGFGAAAIVLLTDDRHQDHCSSWSPYERDIDRLQSPARTPRGRRNRWAGYGPSQAQSRSPDNTRSKPATHRARFPA